MKSNEWIVMNARCQYNGITYDKNEVLKELAKYRNSDDIYYAVRLNYIARNHYAVPDDWRTTAIRSIKRVIKPKIIVKAVISDYIEDLDQDYLHRKKLPEILDEEDYLTGYEGSYRGGDDPGIFHYHLNTEAIGFGNWAYLIETMSGGNGYYQDRSNKYLPSRNIVDAWSRSGYR